MTCAGPCAATLPESKFPTVKGGGRGPVCRACVVARRGTGATPAGRRAAHVARTTTAAPPARTRPVTVDPAPTATDDGPARTRGRTGTAFCGWCYGPPGARVPHHGDRVTSCPCPCPSRNL